MRKSHRTWEQINIKSSETQANEQNVSLGLSQPKCKQSFIKAFWSSGLFL